MPASSPAVINNGHVDKLMQFLVFIGLLVIKSPWYYRIE